MNIPGLDQNLKASAKYTGFKDIKPIVEEYLLWSQQLVGIQGKFSQASAIANDTTMALPDWLGEFIKTQDAVWTRQVGIKGALSSNSSKIKTFISNVSDGNLKKKWEEAFKKMTQAVAAKDSSLNALTVAPRNQYANASDVMKKANQYTSAPKNQPTNQYANATQVKPKDATSQYANSTLANSKDTTSQYANSTEVKKVVKTDTTERKAPPVTQNQYGRNPGTPTNAPQNQYGRLPDLKDAKTEKQVEKIPEQLKRTISMQKTNTTLQNQKKSALPQNQYGKLPETKDTTQNRMQKIPAELQDKKTVPSQKQDTTKNQTKTPTNPYGKVPVNPKK